ncbi:hypothetical protein OS493_026587 [Desmophyllum pertusum]|uniref:Methyltransferase domain-containing protein n=1 Tax=Desmophyllum pertusum TaxID=174260 RepID=A0A9W9YD32_9CNID|nr:hypothetical protein OS493_026587 [Desmophyllum pertusum]
MRYRYEIDTSQGAKVFSRPDTRNDSLAWQCVTKNGSQSTVCSTLCIAAIVAVILAKARKVLNLPIGIKGFFFAYSEAQFAEGTRKIFAPVREKLFSEMKNHLKTMTGDVYILEIGIGAGENFNLLSSRTSLIAVDANPHVEKLLKKNLERVGDRIHLKKFVAASAEDMSCTRTDRGRGQFCCCCCLHAGVGSLTDDQTKKNLARIEKSSDACEYGCMYVF